MPGSHESKLLIIYDLSSQPFSVGDILIVQEASLVLRESHKLKKIDFAVVYDPSKPVVADPAFSYIDPESFLFHLSSILQAAQVNPYLGSFFLFDSHSSLESYVADNKSNYQVWPSLGLYASREYLFYHCFNELFYQFYEANRKLPNLGSRPAAKSWVFEFLRAHVQSPVVGTVQLRRNLNNPERNSNYDAWLGFFRYCADHYPVKFVVICAPAEIDPKLRDLPNVVIAKDHYTSLELDLALIEAADFHMGASSGPSTIAQFNGKPYCVFGWKIDPAVFKDLTHDRHRHRFYFSTPFQNWIVEEENTELLIKEFQNIWKEVQAES